MPNPNPQNQFEPGKSGNPKGRPKRAWTWSKLLEEAVEEVAKDGKSLKYHMARAMVKEILKGNVQAFNAVSNRMDGMPQQDITSAGEKIEAPIVFIPEEKDS